MTAEMLRRASGCGQREAASTEPRHDDRGKRGADQRGAILLQRSRGTMTAERMWRELKDRVDNRASTEPRHAGRGEWSKCGPTRPKGRASTEPPLVAAECSPPTRADRCP